MAANAGSIRAGRAVVEVSVNKDGFDKGLATATRTLQSWGMGLIAIGKGITMPLEHLGGIAAERGRELLHLAEETGTTVEEISALGFAARRTGASSEDMEAALTHLNRLVAEATQGSAGAVEQFDRLGISMNELMPLSTTQRYMLVADRLHQISDAGIRAGSAVSVLGRRGKGLVGMFAGGAAGIQSLMNQASMLGRVITTKEAEDARAFGFELTAIADGLKTATMIIAGGLLPGLRAAFAGDKDIAAGMVSTARAAANWLRTNEDLVKSLFNIGLYTAWAGAGLLVVNHLLPTLALGFRALAMATGLWSLAVQLGVAPLWAMVAGFAAGIAISILFLDAIGQLDYVMGLMGDVWTTVSGDFLRGWQGIKDAIEGGDLETAFRVLTSTINVEWVRLVGLLSNTWAAWASIFRHSGVDMAAEFANVWARITNLTEAGYQEQRRLNEQARGRAHRQVDDILDATVSSNAAGLQDALAEQGQSNEYAAWMRDIAAFRRSQIPAGTPGTGQLTQAGASFGNFQAQAIFGDAGSSGVDRVVDAIRDSLRADQEIGGSIVSAINRIQVGGIATT